MVQKFVRLLVWTYLSLEENMELKKKGLYWDDRLACLHKISGP